MLPSSSELTPCRSVFGTLDLCSVNQEYTAQIPVCGSPHTTWNVSVNRNHTLATGGRQRGHGGTGEQTGKCKSSGPSSRKGLGSSSSGD